MEIPPLTSDQIALLAQPGQSYKKTEILCRLAIYSYLDTPDLTAVMEQMPWEGFQDWDLGENQGFLAWTSESAVVSFRGTDSKADWKKNAKAFWPRRHDLGGRVHRGFNEVFEQASSRVIEIISALDGPPRQFWVTGHSLGGAVATAFSAQQMNQKLDLISRWDVATFGAPRLGDERFEAAYEGRIGNGPCGSHWWFVNDGDPVPHLPPKSFGYQHCGRLFWFNKNGDLVPIDEREVGLQNASMDGSAEAKDQWTAIENSIPDFQNEDEYSLFLEELSEEVGEPTGNVSISPESGNLSADDSFGELQGNLGEWIGKHHKLTLYLDRIRRLT